MKLPRFIHKLYANLHGYFWLPCPICKKMFGGHEISNTSIMTSWHSGECVCLNCSNKAIKFNNNWIKKNPRKIN